MKFKLFFYIILLILIKKIKLYNITKLCYLHTNDIDLENFFYQFKEVDANFKFNKFDLTLDQFLKMEKLNECEFGDNSTYIKIIFDGKTIDEMIRFLEYFGMDKNKKLREFYNITMNIGSSPLISIWKYYKKFISNNNDNNNNNDTSSIESKIDITNLTVDSILGSYLSMFGNLKNRTLIKKMNDTVPRNFFLDTNIMINIMRKNGEYEKRRNTTKKFIDSHSYFVNETDPITQTTTRYRIFKSWKNGNTWPEKISDKIGQFFGVYKDDGNGKHAFRIFDDFITPLIIKIKTDKTYLNRLWDRTKNTAFEIYKPQIDFFGTVFSKEHVSILGNALYNFLIRNRYNSIMNTYEKVKLFVSNPLVQGFKAEEVRKMNKRIEKIDKLGKMIFNSYEVNPNDKKIRYLRQSSLPDIFLENPINPGKIFKNLPDAYNTNRTWYFDFADIFDLNFWNPNASTFTGYAPWDKRTFRVVVPADWISLGIQTGEYIIRSNITMTFLPWLRRFYALPNEAMCLPEPLMIPDPRYGCQLPDFALFPSLYPEDDIEGFFSEFLCLRWNTPWKDFEAVLQIILTPSLGPYVSGNQPLTLALNLVQSIPIIGLKLVNNETGLQGSQALPKGISLCLLPKLPLTAIIGYFIVLFIIKFIESALFHVKIGMIEIYAAATARELKETESQDIYTKKSLWVLLSYLVAQEEEKKKK